MGVEAEVEMIVDDVCGEFEMDADEFDVALTG